jgi:hypothetical protein
LRTEHPQYPQPGNRRQHFPPMPERNAKFLEVLIGQMAEDRNINVVIGKTLGVLEHAELFEPVSNQASQKAYTNISTMARFAYVART